MQRDIDEIISYLVYGSAENGIVIDHARKDFCLKQIYSTQGIDRESLIICKIRLDSRAFTKKSKVNEWMLS